LIQNINEDISIDDLIADQYISKYHFYRIFKAIMGFSVGDYILRIRIYYAAKMIREENEDMLTIAIRFGFQSQEVFTRNFKKLLGVTPLKSRRIALEDFAALHALKPVNLDSVLMEIKSKDGKVTVEENAVHLDTCYFVGMEWISDDDQVHTIPSKMEQFISLIEGVRFNFDEVIYRICHIIDSDVQPSTFKEFIGVAIDFHSFNNDTIDLPMGMMCLEMREGNWIKYAHKGAILEESKEHIVDTYTYYCKHRFAFSSFKLTKSRFFEVYDMKHFFGINHPKTQIDLYFEVESK